MRVSLKVLVVLGLLSSLRAKVSLSSIPLILLLMKRLMTKVRLVPRAGRPGSRPRLSLCKFSR